jgi:hypothetical protein
MPQLGTYGSVRGVPGNRHPYRDRQQCWRAVRRDRSRLLRRCSSTVYDRWRRFCTTAPCRPAGPRDTSGRGCRRWQRGLPKTPHVRTLADLPTIRAQHMHRPTRCASSRRCMRRRAGLRGPHHLVAGGQAGEQLLEVLRLLARGDEKAPRLLIERRRRPPQGLEQHLKFIRGEVVARKGAQAPALAQQVEDRVVRRSGLAELGAIAFEVMRSGFHRVFQCRAAAATSPSTRPSDQRPRRLLVPPSSSPGLPFMLDGGVQRGNDVLKALALGARFVFAGRRVCARGRCRGTGWRGSRHPACSRRDLPRPGDARREWTGRTGSIEHLVAAGPAGEPCSTRTCHCDA